MTIRAALWGLTLFCAAAAHASKAHQHGAVKLDLAVENAQVSIAVEMPLDSLLGFERAPRTEVERQAAAAALQKMRDAAALFRFDAAAQCAPTEVQVEAPVLTPSGAAGGAGDGHADLEASYLFRCQAPARLGALEVLLFDAFRRVERIEVQAVLPHGQRRAVLRRGSRQIRLAP